MVVFEEFETKTGGLLDALDITAEVCSVVRDSGVRSGNVLVFSPHTTCSVLIGATGNGMPAALERVMKVIAPDDGYYAHDDLEIRTENIVEDEPRNAWSHIVHVFMGKASETIPVTDGEPLLGPGQRVLFIELDSSRERKYCIQVVGD